MVVVVAVLHGKALRVPMDLLAVLVAAVEALVEVPKLAEPEQTTSAAAVVAAAILEVLVESAVQV